MRARSNGITRRTFLNAATTSLTGIAAVSAAGPALAAGLDQATPVSKGRLRMIATEARDLRLSQPKDEADDQRTANHGVNRIEGGSTNSDQHLIVVRNRLFDAFKFQNIIGRTVLAISDRFHQFSSGSDAAPAVVRRTPVGELEPGEQNEKDRECAPFQDAFDFHR